MPEHTPAPWLYRLHHPAFGRNVWIVYRGANPDTTVIGPTPQDEADARLIVAAPELLAALAEYLAADDAWNDCCGEATAARLCAAREAARAAIARATGQPTDGGA